LKKLLIAGAIAVLSLAVVAVALAQNPAPTASVTVTVKPEKAGKKKKPKNARIELEAVNSEESRTTASQLDIMIPKKVKLDAKGLKKCKLAKLNSEGKDACPKKSQAGVGDADALLNPNATTPAPLHFVVTAFVGGKKGKKSLLNFYLDSDAPPIHQAIEGVVTKVKGDPVYGQKLTVTIDDSLQQPAPGVYSALLRFKTSLSLKDHKKKLVKTTGCPSSSEHQFGLTIHYVPNPNAPAVDHADATDGAPCS
jgi:hypothetical protein